MAAPAPRILSRGWAASLLLSVLLFGCRGESGGRDPRRDELDPSLQALVRQPSGARSSVPAPAGPGRKGGLFADATAGSGIRFRHVHGGESPIIIYETLGPGACWIDFDSDGFLDLYLVNGNHKRIPNPGDHPINHLFRNRGNGTFEDVTSRAGVGDPGYGLGCAVGDFDNDGDPDLYVTNYGPNVLYRNNGDGTFADVTRGSGVEEPRMSTAAVFADFDGDGLSDLYVANFIDFEHGPIFCTYNGIQSGCSDREYDGLDNALYRNNGNGTFTDVTARGGVSDNRGRSLGVVAADLDLDGDVDLYVANDGGRNGQYLNRGDGTFEDVTLTAGTGYSEEGTGEAGMGVDVDDYDNDGDVDIVVTNFSQETYALYRNEGNDLYTYASAEAGIAIPTYLPLGWGTAFFDYDNDGFLDLFFANGHTYDVSNLINPMDHYAQQNQLFRNRGDGTFEDETASAGSGLALVKVSRSAAFADYDNDGDLDILIGNSGQTPDLLRNEVGARSGHWRTIQLDGSPNRDAIGARVTTVAGNLTQIRQRKAGGSYLSGNDPRVHFGLGTHDRVDTLTIRWPDGTTEIATGLAADLFYLAREGHGIVPVSRGERR